MYFSENEARDLIKKLNSLLVNPEKIDHEHVFSEDSEQEISFSILTTKKIQDINYYTEIEQEIILGLK